MKHFNLAMLTLLLIAGWSLPGTAQQLDTNWLRTYGEIPAPVDQRINVVALGGGEKYLVRHDSNYYLLSAEGDSLGSGSFPAIHQVKSVWAANDTLIFMGSVYNNSPTICRLDTNLNIMWTKSVHSAGFAEGVYAMLVDDTALYVGGSYESSKPFVAKLDFAGNLEWITPVSQTTFSNLTSLVKLKDGNFLASGHLDDYPLAVKFTAQGDTVWTYSENHFISFYKSAAFEKENNEIIMAMRNKIVILDSAGHELDVLHHDTKEFYDILSVEDTLYFFGTFIDTSVSPNLRYAYVEAKNHDLDSLNSFTYMGQNAVNGRFHCAVLSENNSFVTAGYYVDSSGLNNNTWKTVTARFNYAPPVVGVATQQGATFRLTVYPNPAHTVLHIDAPQAEKVQLTDMLGRTTERQLAGSRSLDISGLAPGVYVLSVAANGHTYHARFVKE